MIPDALPVTDLRSSQLYLNAEKLSSVLGRFGPETEFGPLPVYEFDGDLYLTDGHTRAFVAYLTGADRVTVSYDEGLTEEYDTALYRECLQWCDEAGVERVPDFEGRVLSPETYEREWIDRCSRAAERLDGN
ncbi:MAG: histone acetyltransferase [Haloarculaceae archaeon]